MSEEIIKVLDYLGTKFGIAVDWTDKTVMPYLQELADKYINYELVTSTTLIAISIIVFILSVYTLKKRFRVACEKEDINALFCCLAGMGIIVAVPLIGFQIEEIIRCVTFPELQIYDYLSGLIQK